MALRKVLCLGLEDGWCQYFFVVTTTTTKQKTSPNVDICAFLFGLRRYEAITKLPQPPGLVLGPVLEVKTMARIDLLEMR